MPNIIKPKKIKRIVHRFDTTENWKKSNVKLLPGELAFDEHGNFINKHITMVFTILKINNRKIQQVRLNIVSTVED